MSGGPLREQFLFKLPSNVHWEFCRVMDGLSDLDWTQFASEVLKDQTAVRLAERRNRRTDWVMTQWQSRNGRVGELIDLLESLQLFRQRDVILGWTPTINSSPAAPAPAPASLPPPYEQFLAQPTADYSDSRGGDRQLPGPAPPPVNLYSEDHQRPQDTIPPRPPAASNTSSAVICWQHEEVHAGTRGFSPTLQVGEGGFGIVYRASLRNMDCAVKRLRQDGVMNLSLLRRSFQAEVEKLSKFRHPNIVDLLGFSEGGGSMCLIYSYMENQSLEDQLQKACPVLLWHHRISIIEGAAAALQFLHSPPTGPDPLIHGDVKSSNILLDQHWVAKLSDFGLARFAPRGPSDCSPNQTASVGKTTTVRGTLAYLPEEYVTRGELCPAVDVYSFGVVLLEVLTGRRASEQGGRFLKDLVEEVEDIPNCSTAEAWRKHVDKRLIAGGTAEPAGFLQVAALACKCLNRLRKKRPTMTEVFDKLKDIHNLVRQATPSPLRDWQPPYRSFPRPPHSLDSSVEAVSQQLSELGPLESTYPTSQYCFSSSSSSSFSVLTPPRPLHSSSLPTPPSSSLVGPCETDESRGFSQYDLQSQFRPSWTGCRSQNHSTVAPAEFQPSQPSLPTEDQYSFPSLPSSAAGSSGPGSLGAAVPAGPEGFSPAGSLQSTSPGPSVCVNPSKQRLLEKKTQYEDGRIGTPELLSLHDLYGGKSSEELRRPEESDELDYLQSRPT